MKTRLLLVVGILGLAALAYGLGLHQWLTLDALKAHQARLAADIAARPLLSAGIFVAIYVLVAALSLPGAAILTLGGGALFGLLAGVVLVSIASTVGATLAFLSARYLLRETVGERYRDRLAAIDEGIRRDGAFYLLTVRLIPAIPFFIVNLAMGLTAMPVRTFALVSQIGMLPATIAYVNAGTRLGEVSRLEDVLSLPLILSFAALGLLPWIAKAVIRRIRARRLYARWDRPRRFDRNLVVIGGGAAGLVTSYVAAAVKAKVTLVEAGRMGGDCLNSGCVPSKALIQSAKVAHQLRHSAAYGIDAGGIGIRFRDVMARVRTVIQAIEPHDSVERYRGLGVDVVEGHARILDPWRVEIRRADGQAETLTTRAICIATGAAPIVPKLPGLDSVGHVTSETLWDALSARESIPARITILGGGPIGCELAQALQRLGSAVTLVEAAPRLLGREDEEVSALIEETLSAEGVTVLAGHKAIACHLRGGERVIETECGGLRREIAFDLLIVAVGRLARLSGFGLEELGIPARRVVETNEFLETLYPNIFAAGDVAGPYQLTHAAGHQGWHAAVNALFGRFRRFRVDYSAMPAVTFSDPEVARVGLNESEARLRGVPFEVTRYGIDDLDRAIADGKARGFVKVLTVPGRDRILGATIVGAEAGELIAEFAIAMRHGLGLNAILSTIHAYPTRMEANKYAAGLWKKAHAPGWALKLLERYHAWERG